MSKQTNSDRQNDPTVLEDLRLALHKAVSDHDGQLSHPLVIAASERLDEAVMAAQRQLAKTGNLNSQ